MEDARLGVGGVCVPLVIHYGDDVSGVPVFRHQRMVVVALSCLGDRSVFIEHQHLLKEP